MKKLAGILLSTLLICSLTACGNSNQGNSSTEPAEPQTTSSQAEIEDSNMESTEENADVSTEAEGASEAGSSNILVAYFSVMETDGVDTVSGASRVAVNGEVLGNNQYIAQIIQQEVGGDLFSIETVQEYPTTHQPLLEFAYEEKADNARPELSFWF